jgi:hypothetical protein
VKAWWWAVLLVAAAALLVASVLLARYSRRVEDPVALDALHEEIAQIDTTRWIHLVDPERVAAGYTLVLYRHRVPMLIDLNGRVVHSWPGVRVAGRARLTRAGHLLVIGSDDLVKEYDWEGNLVFRYQLAGYEHIPHHDLIQLRNGHYLVLGRESRAHRDYLLEIDPAGRVVWRWRPRDHKESFVTWDDDAVNPSHINSIHEIGENRWFAAGDPRFRPGNLLVSARNLDTVFVIEKSTGEIVWQLRDGLDRQHEALMIPEGRPYGGLILVFNNGSRNRHAYRRSRVQAFHPHTAEVAWEYAAPYFFSTVGGSEQPLWNGNVLVTSSRGGRVFEVTPEGDIIWQWLPPFLPMRALRYARDHCPQLTDLSWDPPRAAENDLVPFIDRGLYQFLLPEQARHLSIEGAQHDVLRHPRSCRKLLIPRDARVIFKYGLNERELDGRLLEVLFTATAREIGSEASLLLLEDVVRSDAPRLWRKATASLEGYPYRLVRLCLDARVLVAAPNGDPEGAIVWANPKIKSRDREVLLPRPQPSRRERELEERRLRAIGYVQ